MGKYCSDGVPVDESDRVLAGHVWLCAGSSNEGESKGRIKL